MKQVFKKLFILLLCVLLTVPQSSVIALAADDDTQTVRIDVTYGQSEARTMLDMVNEFRTGDEAWVWNSDNSSKTTYTDLKELVYDYNLEKIAMQRAAEIALSYSHTRPDGTSCFTLYDSFNSAGENIAAGYKTASDVFEGWKETDDDYDGQGHRRNMLSSSFTAIGVGHVYFNGTHYWVQEFRSPASSAAATEANDSQTTVSIDVLLSDADVSVSVEPDTLTVAVNKSADLPMLSTSIQMSNAWPSRESTVSTDYTWIVEDEQYAKISGDTVTGIKGGTTSLTTSTLGEQVSVPLTVECDHSYDNGVVTTSPTCTKDGVKTYTCTLCGNTYTEAVKATGHTYGEPAFTWSDNNTCTALFTCVEGDDEQEVDCTVTSETTPATAVEDGQTVYTATVSFQGKEYTDTKIVIIPAGSLNPPVISSVYSTVQTSVKVTWNRVEGADGYQLYRSTSKNGNYELTKTITDGDTIKYTNQGLTIGQTYYYKVRAYALDKDGNRVYSDFSAVRYMPAAVIFDNVYSNSTSRIRLLWKEDDGAQGYQIWRSDSENGTYQIVKSITDGSITAYSNTGLTSGKTYYYKMRAYTKVDDQMVFGTYSDVFKVAVMPEAPTVSVSSTASGKVKIGWNQVNGAKGYQIWRSDKKDGNYTVIKSITNGSTTSYTNTGLTSGKTYYYKMRSYTEIDGQKTFSPYSDVKTMKVK